MIARLIGWSARNLLLVLFGAGFAAAAGIHATPPEDFALPPAIRATAQNRTGGVWPRGRQRR